MGIERSFVWEHRRLILLGFLLLAGGILLQRAHQWTTAPATAPTKQLVESQHHEKVQLASVDAVALNTAASPPATTTGFRGRIIDAATRQPVKEFTVQLIHVRPEVATEAEPIIRSFESATGQFSWEDATAGTWRSAVSAPGYQMFNLDDFQISASTTTHELVIPLRRGFAVRGRVFELSTGVGIADAVVGISESFRRSSAYARSNEDGSFTLDGVPGGEVVLTVSAQGHEYRDLEIVVDEQTPQQKIALSIGGTIAGTVMTTAGVPMKGPAWLKGPGPAHLSQTNDAGQFSYSHMRAGPYRVSVSTSAGSARQEFVLGQDEIMDSIALIVGAGRSVHGAVKGLRLEQMQNTRLLLQTRSDNVSLTARLDDSGTYALKGVPPGHAVIKVFGPGLQFNQTVDVPADRDITLDIVFPTGAKLSGRVSQGGKPAASKNVWMRPADKSSGMLYRTTTSKDGQYEIEGLPPGEYQLRADEDLSRAITMAGDAVLNIDIPSVQLSARVVEDGGMVPIVGANVYLRGSAPETARVRGDKQTDDFGQFALAGIEPGEIVLMVYKPGYEMHREKIAYSSPLTNRTITLRKSAGVEVHVQPASRRFPRGFTITQTLPSNDYAVDIWIALDSERVGHVPSALTGTSFQIGRFSGTPIEIKEWDGQPFDLP